jgi:hypothetical protein
LDKNGDGIERRRRDEKDGYLTMLSALRLYSVDDCIIHECGAITGMRTDKRNHKY